LIQAKRDKKKLPDTVMTTETETVVMEKTSIESFLQPANDAVDNAHKKQFYTLLMQGLQDYMIYRFQLQAQTVHTAAAVAILKQQQLTEEADRYQQLMSACEITVFSPLELTDNREELLHAAQKLLQQIEAKHSV
jgi:hypothetical protein